MCQNTCKVARKLKCPKKKSEYSIKGLVQVCPQKVSKIQEKRMVLKEAKNSKVFAKKRGFGPGSGQVSLCQAITGEPASLYGSWQSRSTSGSFGQLRSKSKGLAKKILGQISFADLKDFRTNIFCWPKKPQAKNFRNGQNWPKNGLHQLFIVVFQEIFRNILRPA